MKNVAGIDYSMTSPAICVHKGTDSTWNAENCKFFYMTQKDKFLIKNENITGSLYPVWKTQEERFENLALWAIEILKKEEVLNLSLEGYAMGAKGQVFSIGENTGVLKNKLSKELIHFEIPAPTQIKKYATGKGNSNKETMWDTFYEETKINLFERLGMEMKKNWNPVSDMVDAYYLCKYHFFNMEMPS